MSKAKNISPEDLTELEQEEDLLGKIDELQKTTEQIEAEKEQKRLAREEKKFHKEVAKKRKQQERFIAPLLLLITLLISYFIWKQSH